MPKTSKAKKLVLVSAASSSVTGVSKEAQVTQVAREEKKVILDWVLCIYYLIQFWKDKGAIVQALINSDSEVNAITPAYAKQLGVRIQKTDVRAQRINGLSLDTFEIVIADIQVIDKLSRVRFFQETFLLPNTTMEMVLEMLLVTLSNANI